MISILFKNFSTIQFLKSLPTAAGLRGLGAENFQFAIAN